MNQANCIITPKQVRQKESEYRMWVNIFSNLRLRLLSTAFPEAIILTNDGNVKYLYSEDVENALKEIDKMQEIQMRNLEL